SAHAPQQSYSATFSRPTRRRMSAIERLKLLRCQGQSERNDSLLDMRTPPRCGNCNDVAATDSPGQRNSGCRATVCFTNTCKDGGAGETRTRAAEARRGTYRHRIS